MTTLAASAHLFLIGALLFAVGYEFGYSGTWTSDKLVLGKWLMIGGAISMFPIFLKLWLVILGG